MIVEPQDNSLPYQQESNNSSNTDKTVISVVTSCLTPSHLKCPGVFCDALTGKNLVSCRCFCHN